LAKRFPLVRVQPDPIFVHDGPAWTSAGVTAGIDLALALVEEDLGRTIALAVARYLVVFLKRPGDKPSSAPRWPCKTKAGSMHCTAGSARTYLAIYPSLFWLTKQE
jgi:transcriptional regulator GlxA family with amidase domain